MNDVVLHGRDGDRNAVTATPEGFMLIVGDSGIGKSVFLSSLTTWPGQTLVSSPIVLKSVEGSLQTALADAISDCMTQYLENASDAHTAWTMVKSVAERAKTITGREIGNAVLARALTYAESKLGKEVVDIGKKVLGDISKGGLLGFDDRLASIRVPDLAKDLCDIAADLSETVGCPLVLRLDNAERLAPSDHGLLSELVDAITGHVRILACVTPHHAAGDAIIQQVSQRGVAPHTLLPLSHPAIEDWLVAAHVPQARWDTIIRLSSGYPFFIADAIRLVGASAPVDQLAAPSGFEALMHASWNTIPEGIQATAARLAPFTEPPSEDFLLEYLGFDALQWGILTNTLLKSGLFVRRSDGAAWFHDRRRSFIWEQVLNDSARKYVAGTAFAAVASWVNGQSNFELWVPSAMAVLARATEPSATGILTPDLLALPDEGIALLWGLIEIIEPDSVLAPFAEILKVIRHAEARSGRAIDALATMNQLESSGLIETHEADNARLVRSNVLQTTDYATLLGEIQLRFHTTPRPRLATALFAAFIRPVLGSFERAVFTLGRSTLVGHKTQAKLLHDPKATGHTDDSLAFGASVTIDDQPLSFTAKFATREARDEAELAVLAIPGLASRVQLDRVVSLPQPRLRYTRYELAAKSLGHQLTAKPEATPDEIIEFLNLRTRYAESLGLVSTRDEKEVLNLGLRRFLIDMRTNPGSWTTFEIQTDNVQPTRDISELAVDLWDPLFEIRLRDAGYLTGGETVAKRVVHLGTKSSIPHPLTAVLDDIDAAGKAYNSGLRQVLFTPDTKLLEREIHLERQRLSNVMGALSAGVASANTHRRSLLIGFWEDTDVGWHSDFGNWSACALEVDDDQNAVVVRKLRQSPIDASTRSTMTAPDVFEGHAGATVFSMESGQASSVIGPFLGYQDDDVQMMDLEMPLGTMIRNRFDVIGESELAI